METLLWITNLLCVFWILWTPFHFFIGSGIYLYLSFLTWFYLYEVIWLLKNPFEWFNGPLRRSIMGWIIFSISLLLNNTPFVNMLSSFFMAWWAVADYYDYDYTLFG